MAVFATITIFAASFPANVRHYSECADIVHTLPRYIRLGNASKRRVFCNCRMDVSSKWTSPKCHIEAKIQNKKNGMQTRKSASGKNSMCKSDEDSRFLHYLHWSRRNGEMFFLPSFLVQKTNSCFFMALLAKMLRTTQTEIPKPNV